MIGKILKITVWGTIAVATGLGAIALLGALDDADYPLE